MITYPIPRDVPDAPVVTREGAIVTIRCPLCGERHQHKIVEEHRTAWRAAACALYAPVNRDDRVRGYQIQSN